jgi:predicted N-acetyltransferase YhbS
MALRNNQFSFFKGYQKDDQRRAAFNQLAEKTFPITFEVWYKSGFWNEKYIPYTLFDGSKAIANVSANIMDFNVLGERKRFIQLGTVMTDVDYRNKGLSRFLMEKVLEEWNGKCDFVYLYANSTVLDFYPKLGFAPVKEYEYFKSVKSAGSSTFVKLNMDEQTNRDTLHDYVRNTKIFGKLSMQENADLVLFYCITSMKNRVYYSKPLDVIVIAKFNNEQLHLLDVFSKVDVSLDDVISSLIDEKVKTVSLGFTPKDCTSFEMRKIDEVEKDEVLFIQNSRTALFDENELMFPLLSHA